MPKKAGKALPLILLLLAGCQQASVPEPENSRPQVNLVVDRDVDPVPLEVKLTAQGTDPDGDPLTYFWSITSEDFQGEDFEGDAFQDYTFTDPGEYTVEVTASDGKLDSERDSVVILALSPDEPGL